MAHAAHEGKFHQETEKLAVLKQKKIQQFMEAVLAMD